jgi:hypothetical protein
MADSKVYYLAETARAKLSHEVASNDHNLRRILGHANMLARLMAELVNRGYQHDGGEEEYVECMQDLAVAEDKPRAIMAGPV